jgi:LPXTG-motif cell wall-anchored protein
MRSRIACLLAAIALAVPAGAWAQSAGDDQYQDPFAPESGQTEDSGNGSDGSSETPAAQPTPEPATPPAPAPAPAAPAANVQQLPRTGADEGLVALAGTVLLVSGLALRRRTGSPADRA